jgi:hypothetical protein
MKLVFFDEAKNDPDYPHYHIGATCIDEQELSVLEQRISAISQKAFGTAELSRATELHAANIYHRKSNFKHRRVFHERLEIIKDFIDILSLDAVQLIDVQINCDLLQASQSAEEIAFMFLCERANDLVKSKGSLGMLIGDRESDHLSDRFSTTLSGYRAQGTNFAFGRDIHNLVDSVHFTHSHLSRFLQLADIYAWLLQFVNRNRGSSDARHLQVFGLLRRDEVNLFPSKHKEWPK